jgi:hypothetical protein
MGSGAKSYMRKSFLIYEEMRKYFTKYEEALVIYSMTLHPIPLNFLIYEENFLFFFISADFFGGGFCLRSCFQGHFKQGLSNNSNGREKKGIIR